MKRKIFAVMWVVILTVMCGIVGMAEESETEEMSGIKFLDYKWGATWDDVFGAEIDDEMVDGTDYAYSKEDKLIMLFDRKVAGYDTTTYFVFNDKLELNMGMYDIQEKHTNKTDYYTDYCDLVDKYTEKYGEPGVSQENWKNDLLKDDPQNWGLAISRGDVNFGTAWKDKEGAMITLILEGDNYEINLSISYFSPSHEFEDDTEGI